MAQSATLVKEGRHVCRFFLIAQRCFKGTVQLCNTFCSWQGLLLIQARLVKVRDYAVIPEGCQAGCQLVSTCTWREWRPLKQWQQEKMPPPVALEDCPVCDKPHPL